MQLDNQKECEISRPSAPEQQEIHMYRVTLSIARLGSVKRFHESCYFSLHEWQLFFCQPAKGNLKGSI